MRSMPTATPDVGIGRPLPTRPRLTLFGAAPAVIPDARSAILDPAEAAFAAPDPGSPLRSGRDDIVSCSRGWPARLAMRPCPRNMHGETDAGER
jgi:hypothetical protein